MAIDMHLTLRRAKTIHYGNCRRIIADYRVQIAYIDVNVALVIGHCRAIIKIISQSFAKLLHASLFQINFSQSVST